MSAEMIAVVMVNWNRAADTLQAYASLQSSAEKGWRLIVVDNASSDGSFDVLSQAVGGDATVLQSGGNLGFAGGCNVGILKALELGADYIYLLNNDATVLPSTLTELLSAAKGFGDRCVLGSVVKFAGSDRYQFFGADLDPRAGLPIWHTDKNADLLGQAFIPTAFVLGAALFAPRALWEELGPLDERYFLNFEETDWCRRAQAAGAACNMVVSSVIMHAAGATLGPNDGPLQVYFLTRNELLFSEIHGSAAQRVRVASRRATRIASSLFRAIGRTGRADLYTKAMVRGVKDYLSRKFGDCPDIIREYNKRYRLENPIPEAGH
jgi:GT2 family glycosyltransferase